MYRRNADEMELAASPSESTTRVRRCRRRCRDLSDTVRRERRRLVPREQCTWFALSLNLPLDILPITDARSTSHSKRHSSRSLAPPGGGRLTNNNYCPELRNHRIRTHRSFCGGLSFTFTFEKSPPPSAGRVATSVVQSVRNLPPGPSPAELAMPGARE